MVHRVWIRGPVWDGVFMLSGLPIGLVLAAGFIPLPSIIAGYLVLNGGHLASPVATAWCHPEFRRVMLRARLKYIVVPTIIIALGMLAGATVGKVFSINPVTLGIKGVEWQDYARPMIALLPIYFAWNAYHFAMQNYGFLRIYRPGIDRTVAMQWAMFATLFGLVIIPQLFRQPIIFLFLFGLVTVNHQLSAIGLASHVWANRHQRSPLWFAAALLTLGSGMAWLILHSPGRVAMTLIGTLLSMGFVHFLYDRWIYRFSDQRVLDTIGRDLFANRSRAIPPFPAAI